MPVLSRPSAPTHEFGATRFTALASPSRGSSELAVWQVEIAPGTPPTPHALTREEVFVVLEGTAELRIGGTVTTARAGDAIAVPPGQMFELANAGDRPLIAVCCMSSGGRAYLAGQEPFAPPWTV